jgi:hypothetical protein
MALTSALSNTLRAGLRDSKNFVKGLARPYQAVARPFRRSRPDASHRSRDARRVPASADYSSVKCPRPAAGG